MAHSITLSVPPASRILTLVGAIAAIAAIVIVGAWVGSRLIAPDPIGGLANPGGVQQIRVTGGAVYVGRIVSSSGGYLRLSDAAIIRQGDTAADASPGPRLIVESLAAEPYDTGTDLVIPISSVEFATTVRPGSGLEAAYRQAIGGAPPSPGSSAAP